MAEPQVSSTGQPLVRKPVSTETLSTSWNKADPSALTQNHAAHITHFDNGNYEAVSRQPNGYSVTVGVTPASDSAPSHVNFFASNSDLNVSAQARGTLVNGHVELGDITERSAGKTTVHHKADPANAAVFKSLEATANAAYMGIQAQMHPTVAKTQPQGDLARALSDPNLTMEERSRLAQKGAMDSFQPGAAPQSGQTAPQAQGPAPQTQMPPNAQRGNYSGIPRTPFNAPQTTQGAQQPPQNGQDTSNRVTTKYGAQHTAAPVGAPVPGEGTWQPGGFAAVRVPDNNWTGTATITHDDCPPQQYLDKLNRVSIIETRPSDGEFRSIMGHVDKDTKQVIIDKISVKDRGGSMVQIDPKATDPASKKIVAESQQQLDGSVARLRGIHNQASVAPVQAPQNMAQKRMAPGAMG